MPLQLITSIKGAVVKKENQMSRKYKNPPIVEALCEFQFISEQAWDFTIHGLFYEKINKDFPDKQKQMGIGIRLKKEANTIQHEVSQSPERMQFFRKDKTALVQVGPDLLTVNHLKPYPTWKFFKPLILDNLSKYREIAKPKGLKRLGLRYINKIDIPQKSIELSDYFNYYPYIPKVLPQIHGAFTVRTEIPYEENRDQMLLTIGSAISEKPDALSFLLDFDYVMVIPDKVAIDQVGEWIEKAHAVVEENFEACITDKCRKIFDEE